ncbi:hypothetical protein AKJ09_09946 [Labilithrix luteola]|uniref:Uncharacterized protein n=1 Tax=Labilithrix luteola TaxID=1391654 RepID=A0A0K1QC33_9BACT|nr:hypothetical protein AKJ09_09946 [Labilithrix luteola]
MRRRRETGSSQSLDRGVFAEPTSYAAPSMSGDGVPAVQCKMKNKVLSLPSTNGLDVRAGSQ